MTLVGWLAVLAASVVVAGLSVLTVLRSRGGRSTSGPGAPEGENPDLDPEGTETGTGEGGGAEPALPDQDIQARDRVGFTLYRPEEVKAGSVVPVIAYAHLATYPSLIPGQPPEVPSEVEEDVARHFQPTDRVQASTAEHTGRFAPSDALTFRLTVDGCQVSPSEAVVHWDPPFQSVPFNVTIPHTIPGPQLAGRLVVYEGIFVRGTVEFSMRMGRGEVAGAPVAGRAFDKVFPSYSHQDAAIVDYVEEAALSLGHEFLRDVRKLRAGEEWSEEIRGYIEEADLFQLFWSSRSMASPYVRQEWEHALSLGRQGFILPVYWEDPLPSSPREGLPPPALGRIHFHHLYVGPPDPDAEETAVVPVRGSSTRTRPDSPPEPRPLPTPAPPPAPPSERTLVFRVPGHEHEPDPEAGSGDRSGPGLPPERMTRASRRFNPMVWMPAAAVLLLAVAVPVVMNPGATAPDPAAVEPDPVELPPPVGMGASRPVVVGVPLLSGDSLTPGDRERLTRAIRGTLGGGVGEIRLVSVPVSGLDPSATDSLRTLAAGLGATYLVLPGQEIPGSEPLGLEELATGRRIRR